MRLVALEKEEVLRLLEAGQATWPTENHRAQSAIGCEGVTPRWR
jgi:hypothetical protein